MCAKGELGLQIRHQKANSPTLPDVDIPTPMQNSPEIEEETIEQINENQIPEDMLTSLAEVIGASQRKKLAKVNI